MEQIYKVLYNMLASLFHSLICMYMYITKLYVQSFHHVYAE